MGRADDLRALADEVDRYDALESAYLAAQAAVRANPDNPDAAEQYRTAKVALAEHRTAVREAQGRAGVGFGSDMIRSEG